ncbi:MAG: hypothetical protein ACI959_000661 [Limisphaerales bacterium]
MIETRESNENASLGQNIPNPFNGTTLISYYVPFVKSQASIVIIDLAGRIVAEYDIRETGFGQVEFSNSEITSGSYHYSLFVDGKKIDSKQMVMQR